jgi:thioredoxin reductase
MSPKRYDVAVVGGRPAGLCAGLWLARYLHKVVVIDSGDPRNWETRAINGYLGHQGIRPPELRALGREECTKVQVEFVSGVVDTAVNETGELFARCLRDGTTIERSNSARHRHQGLLAGHSGLERCYGETFACPDCDGYETRDKKTIVVGTGRKAVGLALPSRRGRANSSSARMARNPT